MLMGLNYSRALNKALSKNTLGSLSLGSLGGLSALGGKMNPSDNPALQARMNSLLKEVRAARVVSWGLRATPLSPPMGRTAFFARRRPRGG